MKTVQKVKEVMKEEIISGNDITESSAKLFYRTINMKQQKVTAKSITGKSRRRNPFN